MADILDGVFSDAAPEPVVEPAPEPVIEQAPEPTPEPAAPEPIAPIETPQEHSVPLARYLDTRDELKELRRWKAEQEAKATPQARPDPFDDPEGYATHFETQMNERLFAQKLQMSDQMARDKHGEEATQAAIDWAAKKAVEDPMFGPSYANQPHPIDWIVRQHKQQAIVSQLPSDISSLDELIEREIAKRGLVATAAVAPQLAASTQQAPKPAAPPPSLVDAPSSGGVGHMPVGTAVALEAVFPK